MTRVADGVTALELPSYQRAVRLLLANPLMTQDFPNRDALPLVRRWAAALRADLADQLDYQLELTPSTARLIRVNDELDGTQPARTATGREFDRRRYAYMALALASLGRAGTQVALSELAAAVAADAGRIEGLGLDTQRAGDRAAFVDAVAWLQDRGAVRLADGSARRWADDPLQAEALYDIDRDVVNAIYRPTRVLQHVPTVTGLLARSDAVSRDTRRTEAGRRARRAVVERPVTYYKDVDPDVRNSMRTPALISDVERLTGCVVERRAEGLALIDTSQGFTDLRFPGTGTVAQAALLLVGEIADRIDDPDAPALARLPEPAGSERQDRLAAVIDAALPLASMVADLAEPIETAPTGPAGEAPENPLLGEAWLRTTMTSLVERYGVTFGAAWRTDPGRLLEAAIEVLANMRMLARVEGGVLALPLLARYRNTVVEVRRRKAEPSLFDVDE